MDLFSEENKEILGQKFSPSWNSKLSHITSSPNFENLISNIDMMYKQKSPVVYPDRTEVFKAFHLTDWYDVKVIVLGQDPYHNGNADGLAFSCKREISPSLKQILHAISIDLSEEIISTQPIKLDYLSKQGVLLLNTNLTVEAGKPLSHSNLGWERFIGLVLDTFKNRPKIVWMLWGAQAQKFEKHTGKDHLVLRAPHPVSASYSNTNWKCSHFSTCNEFLKDFSIEPIKWLENN